MALRYLGGLVAEEVLELVCVEAGESLAVVDGFAYDDHRREGQLVLLDDLR